jgi:hypothetical protein
MLARTFAGIVLGLPLSLALIALCIWLWPGGSESVTMPLLVAFFPVWTGVMAATYLFRNGTQAWAWLALANLAAFGALFVARHTLAGL